MRVFQKADLRQITDPKVRAVLRPTIRWIASGSRALAQSIQRQNNPRAIVDAPVDTPPQPNPTTEFFDSQFRIKNFTVNSKQLGFSAALVPDNTTVILNAPAVSGDIALMTAVAPIGAAYIVQTVNSQLTNEQSLGALTTGVLLNTVTAGVGVLSKAVGADLPAHNLLSTQHGDTLAGSPTRGDLIVANSTPAWAKKAIGAKNTVLGSDGTDPSWRGLASGSVDLTAQTGNIGNTNLLTTVAAGIYRVSFNIECTTAGTAGSQTRFVVTYNDGATRNIDVYLLPADQLGGFSYLDHPLVASPTTGFGHVIIRSAASQNISFSTSGVYNGNPQYAVYGRAEFLG